MTEEQKWHGEITTLRADFNLIVSKFKDLTVNTEADSRILGRIDATLTALLAKHGEQEKAFTVVQDKVSQNCKAYQAHELKIARNEQTLQGVKKWVQRIENECDTNCSGFKIALEKSLSGLVTETAATIDTLEKQSKESLDSAKKRLASLTEDHKTDSDTATKYAQNTRMILYIGAINLIVGYGISQYVLYTSLIRMCTMHH